MCITPDNPVVTIRDDAIQMADNLINGRNIDNIEDIELREIFNNLIDFIIAQVRENFPELDGSDSGERADIERNIAHRVVHHINDQSLNTQQVNFDNNNFIFFRS